MKFDTSELSSTVTITNDGETALSVSFKMSDLQDEDEFNSWSLGAVPGSDTFVLRYQNVTTGSYTTLTDSYQTLISNLDISESDTFKLKLYMPELSTYKEKMYGTLTIKYTGNVETETTFDITVTPYSPTNDSLDNYYLTSSDIISGGFFGVNMFYIDPPTNATINTTFNFLMAIF